MLNSLSEEKLFASVRILAKNGKFLEIGKYDLANNSELGKQKCVVYQKRGIYCLQKY